MVMAEQVTRNRTPIKVGFYDVVRTIGRGNFAVVKLARHRITKTEVAIKIIDKLRLDQLNLEKIYREIQILKLLNHQHIIKLYQVMETSSTIYLVCEYARNGELFDYITDQGRLPEDKAKKMFWQVLTAVEYCHKNNVVHRDLKAENLLLDSNNNIKLADFGFSNFYQSGNMLSTWCGSPPYAAPEVFEGKLYDGPHLDVWSLGVVLYVLVCGTFPFDGSNLATLKDRVLGGRFRIPYWMSQDCENLVRRMLVINPKKRLTIAQIKKHSWMQDCNPSLALAQVKRSPQLSRRGKLSEYNEHVLKIMQGLGINKQKTLESLSLSAYDHLYAIYHLLADRLKLHRTSFPLASNILFDGGRRRPSNVADQTLTTMKHTSPTLAVHQEVSSAVSSLSSQETPLSIQPPAVPDVQFDDMTIGLPTVQRTLTAPAPHGAAPLPHIRTSMFEESVRSETASVPYGSQPDPVYVSCQNEIKFPVPSSNPQNTQFLTADYQQRSSEMEDSNLGAYNLHQRRHTLMAPNPSQMQMLRSGLGCGGQTSPQLSPHSSIAKLSRSGDEMMHPDNLAESLFPGLDSSSAQNCDGTFCNNPGCVCKQTDMAFSPNQGNLLLPCKNLPTSPDFNFDHSKSDARAQLRRRSGAPGIMNAEGAVAGQGTKNQELKAAFFSRQRQQLDSSPIGFRQGRRASDGLLLLGDNKLKEHLQKLAHVAAVPEIATEDADETREAESKAQDTHRLQVPVRNQVNRTKSAERNFPQPQSSPGASPVGSGGNISYQPYNNNQSLARRRSLHAQHLQIRSAIPSVSQPQEVEECQLLASISQQQQQQQQQQQTFVANVSLPPTANGRPGYIHIPANDASCQWSSWKPVHGNSPSDGNKEMTQTMWQQLSMMKSSAGWNELGMGTLAVASDEAVSSKAAAAQQEQQMESKPIRQQSLPISPTSTSHPFGTGQHPSMAQILQQRRLQRRLKVAATHQQQMVPGYQMPLPELEQLNIGSTNAVGRLQVAGMKLSPSNYYYPMQQCNEHEFMGNWGQGVLSRDIADFQNIERSDAVPCLGFPNPGVATNYIAFTGAKEETQIPWSCDMQAIYRKSFEFGNDKGFLAEGSLMNSTEKLEHAGGETMEFALY